MAHEESGFLIELILVSTVYVYIHQEQEMCAENCWNYRPMDLAAEKKR